MSAPQNAIMKPDQDPHSPRSQLFSVRVWREELAENQHEWRGKVQHVASGEVYYFRQWSELASLMVAWLEEGEEPEK